MERIFLTACLIGGKRGLALNPLNRLLITSLNSSLTQSPLDPLHEHAPKNTYHACASFDFPAGVGPCDSMFRLSFIALPLLNPLTGALSEMKKLVIVGAVVAALYLSLGQIGALRQSADTPVPAQSDKLGNAFTEQTSGSQVAGEGIVTKLLSDDNKGSRHQRFILTLASGQTLLVAHNIDLAPRLAALKPGDAVAFNGVYEWNAKGGVIHWTHRDPSGRHQAGWLKHAGQTYQ